MKHFTWTVFLILAGCMSFPSKIIEIGPNTYTLNVTGTGFKTQGATSMEATSQASDFCTKKGRHLLLKDTQESGVYGWSPRRSTLTFQCTE